MAIALVDTGSNLSGVIANTTIDITGIDVSGSDRVLYVAVTWGSNTAAPTAAVVSWSGNGTPQDFETADTSNPIASGSNPGRGTALFRLKNPTVETNGTVSVSNLNGSIGEVALVVSLSGVDQTTPNDTIDIFESGGGGAVTTTPSGSITTESGDWILSFCAGADATPNFTISANATIRESIGTSTGSNNCLSMADDRNGSSGITTWTHDSGTNFMAITFNVNASAASVAPLTVGSIGEPVIGGSTF